MEAKKGLNNQYLAPTVTNGRTNILSVTNSAGTSGGENRPDIIIPEKQPNRIFQENPINVDNVGAILGVIPSSSNGENSNKRRWLSAHKSTGSNNTGFDNGSHAFVAGTESLPTKIRKIEQTQNDNSATIPSNNGRNQEVISSFVGLPPVGSTLATLPALNQIELTELESALEIDTNDDNEEYHWKGDWEGNLAFVNKEIVNPSVRSKRNGAFRQTLMCWAQKGNMVCVKLIHYLFRYVYRLQDTPLNAKQIFANVNPNSLVEMELAARRALYDPIVLQQDGWTIAKSKESIGATGGPYRIGDRIRWQNFEAVIIAYIHDTDMGDLWRAIWIDDTIETFDLEAEELELAKKSWEKEKNKKIPQQQSVKTTSRRSARNPASDDDFSVSGVEYGIVLAATYSKGARSGVYWPARIMHASEMAFPQKSRSTPRRRRLDLVFLAPYWNSSQVSNPTRVTGNVRENLSDRPESKYSSGQLFEIETIDASDEMIKAYPYEGNVVDIEKIRFAFKFTGLPKSVFKRFLDSHRIALSLKAYAKQYLKSTLTKSDMASAGLFGSHSLSVQTPIYPPEILRIQFYYILSQLPPLAKYNLAVNNGDDEKRNTEPIIQLREIVNSMKPPHCWGLKNLATETMVNTPIKPLPRVVESPAFRIGNEVRQGGQSFAPLEIDHFISDLKELREIVLNSHRSKSIEILIESLKHLLTSLSCEVGVNGKKSKEKAKMLINTWAITKGLGDEVICAAFAGNRLVVVEWRRACERIYKYITQVFSSPGYGNGVSTVLTDSRCNRHITSNGCFERQVRLPAAVKAAKKAGAGTKENIKLITTIEDYYINVAENDVILKAHNASYLKKMKEKCSAIPNDTDVVPLTGDSDGQGGEDTNGSRGTWMAAVASVAAAIKAVDMVAKGECVNAFCITRPPGHHAGRALHAMKAISNGFCVLNTAACAALHATAPTRDKGLGLKRVCIIDFDVHHGNGTQDVLCSTYDPRFLYVSMHAGGSQVNGASDDNDDLDKELDKDLHSPGGSSKLKGIYPGRCGDTSPHKGVLNIPLGARVTPHAVGTALINEVTPAVDKFSPDMIIISAGFDAHKNDPLCLGGLSAQDFGHITEAVCQMAYKCCSGRIVSILEGGYGVPCCRRQTNMFLPPSLMPSNSSEGNELSMLNTPPAQERPQPSKLLDLGDGLPFDMDDQVPYILQRRLEKCHGEGFMECVSNHVQSLARCNNRN